MLEDNRKKITIFVDEALHRAAKMKVAGSASSFQEVINGLLMEWTEGHKTIQTPATRRPSPRDRWHAALDEILDAHDPELISATHHLLSLMRRVATGQPAPPTKKVR